MIAERRDDPATSRPIEGGALDAHWADDFHHAPQSLLTGEDGLLRRAVADRGLRRDGGPRERARRARGDRRRRRVAQNHDQVGNRALGDRLPPAARPLAALCMLLAPFTPMLFMGEEYGEKHAFQFFTDHIEKKIAEATRKGRRKEFEPSSTSPAKCPTRRTRRPSSARSSTARGGYRAELAPLGAPSCGALTRRRWGARRRRRLHFDERAVGSCTARERVPPPGEDATEADGEACYCRPGGAVLR